MTIDYTPAIVGDDSIKVSSDKPIQFTVTVEYVEGSEVVRVTMGDFKTGNNAVRNVTDGMVKARHSARIPAKVIYALLPAMTEEIVVLNRLLGHTIPEPEEAE